MKKSSTILIRINKNLLLSNKLSIYESMIFKNLKIYSSIASLLIINECSKLNIISIKTSINIK